MSEKSVSVLLAATHCVVERRWLGVKIQDYSVFFHRLSEWGALF